MLKHLILNGFPFAADIIISLVLFVGRHALASAGYDERTVGSVLLFYGGGYVIAGLAMTRVVKPRIAKAQMLASLAGMALISLALANVQGLRATQVCYALFPFAASLFFNSFQIFMLGVATADARPLAVTAGHFTLSWSVGFALGPLISSMLKNALPWAGLYYIAAAIAVLMGAALLRFRPAAPTSSSPSAEPASPVLSTDHSPQLAHPRSLIGPAWLGLLVGWTAWNAALIYWPVQAVALGIPPHLRSVVEATAALTQGLGALALTVLPGWHRRPGWLLAFGALAVGALLLLSTTATQATAFGLAKFGAAALLYGSFMASMFSALVYHAMVDADKAVHRVALGETLVGVCFLISSPVATLLHREGTPFARSYLALAALLTVGLVAQALYALALTRPRQVAKGLGAGD